MNDMAKEYTHHGNRDEEQTREVILDDNIDVHTRGRKAFEHESIDSLLHFDLPKTFAA